MLPQFGCNLHDYVFELPDLAAVTLVRSEVIDALTRWEPRIVDIAVDVRLDEIHTGKLILDVGYTVRDTNRPDNLVFPYYLYEGVGDEL